MITNGIYRLSRLLNDFSSAQLSDLRILIINEAERRSRFLFKKLKANANTIPVHQDKLEVQRNQTLWSLLEGGKDDFYIYDRCGRLAYFVPYPISFLNRPYAKAAILSTYFDQPCGPCPTDAIVPSNCTISNLNDTEDNCTVTDASSVDNSTDLSLNDTVDDPNDDQNITTIGPLVSPNITSTTVSPSRAQFKPVIDEFREKYGNQTGHRHHQHGHRHHTFNHSRHGRPSFRRHGHRKIHGHRQFDKFTTSPTPHGHDRSNETVPTTNGHHKTSHHGHSQNHSHIGHVHHNKDDRFGVPKSVHNTSHHRNHVVDTEVKQLVNQSDSENNSTDDSFESSNVTTTAKPISQSSASFYKLFYPDYEMILNLALADWLKKPIPRRTLATATTVPTTVKRPLVTLGPTTSSTQAHVSYLVEVLKRAKSRQQSEMIH